MDEIFDDEDLVESLEKLPVSDDSDIWPRLYRVGKYLLLIGAVDEALDVCRFAYSSQVKVPESSGSIFGDAVISSLCLCRKVEDISYGKPAPKKITSETPLKERVARMQGIILGRLIMGAREVPDAPLQSLSHLHKHSFAQQHVRTEPKKALEALKLLLETGGLDLPPRLNYTPITGPLIPYHSACACLLGVDLALRARAADTAIIFMKQWLKVFAAGLPVAEEALSLVTFASLACHGVLADHSKLRAEERKQLIATCLSRLKEGKKTAIVAPHLFDWKTLMENWRKLNPRPARSKKSGDIKGATEHKLIESEERLGTKLPDSYRTFLKFSNGWRPLDGAIEELSSIDSVGWFRDKNPDWLKAWTSRPVDVPDDQYFQYGELQDPITIRSAYLHDALQISEGGDAAVLLLNPRIKTEDGEWEAWFFATWLPGAHRFRNFQQLMQARFDSLKRNTRKRPRRRLKS